MQMRSAVAVLALLLATVLKAADPQIDPPWGLVAWWSGEDGALDELHRANGTLQSGATNAPGLVGNGFLLGSGGFVSVPDLDELNPLHAMTLEAWVFQERQVGSYDTIVKKAGNGGGYSLEYNGSGTVAFWVYINDRGWVGVSAPGAPSGRWFHIAGSYDGVTVRIYLDGSMAGSTPMSGQIAPSRNPLRMGSDLMSPGRTFQGRIDEVCLYDRALSAGEVASVHAATAGKRHFPMLLTGPEDQAVRAGAEARFTVAADSQTPVGYQWRRNGVELAGETGSSLVLTNVSSADAGAYSVVVTNVLGQAVSRAGMLNVLSAAPYVFQFSKPPLGTDWSRTNITTTPNGARTFLGPYGNETVTLSLTNLAPHNLVRLEFDLVSIQTWDGNDDVYGPDYWSVGIRGSAPLLQTTFRSGRTADTDSSQAFPAQAGEGVFPGEFKSVETGTLGYGWTSWPNWVGSVDRVYHLAFDIPHTATGLVVDFAGSGLQGLADESWGLDKVVVSPVTNSVGVVQFDVGGHSVFEDAGKVVLNVRRSGATNGTTSVLFNTRDHTATAGRNYQAQTGALSFAPGETSQSITLSLPGGEPLDGDMMFAVDLVAAPSGGVVGANATCDVSILKLPVIEFAYTNYYCTEADGGVPVPIVRTGHPTRVTTLSGTSRSGTAIAGVDFDNFNSSSLTFSTNVLQISMSVGLRDNAVLDGQRTFGVSLASPVGARLGGKTNSTVVVVDNDTQGGSPFGVSGSVRDAVQPPDGRILVAGVFKYANGVREESVARFNLDGSLDQAFGFGMAYNGSVEALALQADGKVIAVGGFTQVFGLARVRVVRLQAAGGIDPSFSGTLKPDAIVYGVQVQPWDGKILIAGSFATVNSVARSRIARLNTDGTLDTTFVPPTFTGGNNTMWSMVLLTNKSVLCGGFFGSVTGGTHPNLVMLKPDGSLDTTFNASGAGPNSGVYSMALLPSGKVLIGGDFTTYNGVGRTRLARINTDGTLDTGFAVGTGADGRVARRLGVLPDGRCYIGGSFLTYNGTARSRLARVNANGSLDTAFSPSGGANALVYSMTPLADGRVFVAGDFTVFDGQDRLRCAFVNPDGSVPAEPRNWVQWKASGGGNGHWYGMTSKPTSWTAAESEAIQWGAHLVAINDEREQSFLADSVLTNANLLRPFWIGLTDRAAEGQFAWTTGESLAFENWFPGEPNDAGGNEDYVQMNIGLSRYATTDGLPFLCWNDITPAGNANLGRATAPNYGIIELEYDPGVITITKQPQSGTYVSGETVLLSVNAVGAPPLSYQWRNNGANIDGATGRSLSLGAMSPSGPGVYSVVISNSTSAVTSSNAVIGLYPQPLFLADSIKLLDGKVVAVSVTGVAPERILEVQSTTNLTEARWETVALWTNTPVNVLEFANTNAPGQCFFRLIQHTK